MRPCIGPWGTLRYVPMLPVFETHEAHVPPNAGPDGGMHFYFFKVQDAEGNNAIDA
ncbi:hypothetical protein KO532_09080 [Zobellia galactanivorans]|nr:hypothetical protein [Zobellia galactanivorans]